jgi:hypothetical protein
MHASSTYLGGINQVKVYEPAEYGPKEAGR